MELNNPDNRNPSFIAPYVKFDFNKGQGNKPYTTLTFKLVVTDKRTGLSSDPSMSNNHCQDDTKGSNLTRRRCTWSI